ncbi:MAG TPA: gephyrin-like molybdotransferase Glp, partial [Solirubrobacteraceae bacterium]|nr:gephyrin-like molybdotransferase Glp [Solirubrobacteraceae bacterium]
SGPQGRTLRIVGESRAGAPAGVGVEDGEAIRISTGAVVPEGADAIAPVEEVREEDGTVHLLADVAPGRHVRGAGEDLHAGALVLPAGTRLGPAELGALVNAGLAEAPCTWRPRVAVLATGDELRPPGEPLAPGQIHDANLVTIAALAARAGAEVVLAEHVGDDPVATRDALARALEAADVVCVSGGVSVGPHDHVKPALTALGVAERFWRIRLKPGKPVWFGTRDRRLVFGLPGNPVSAMVTFTLLARPALRALQGEPDADRRGRGVLGSPLDRDPERDQAVRVRLAAGDSGVRVVPTTGAQGSHVLSSMVGAQALALIPAGEGELPEGAEVELELL